VISFIQGLVMSRSLRISPQYIERVKRAVKHNGFFRQRDLAEELQLALSTVSSFLNGRRVDYATFYEICERLGLELKEIADLEDERSDRAFSAEALELATVDCSGEETGTAVSDYMERPPIESRCNETILQPGSLLRIKAPKRMGKTWLIDRILAQATKQKYRTVNLSLLLADGSVLSSLDKFLRWFCGIVGRELRLRDQLTDYWVDELGSSQSCTIYFEEYLLSQLEHPLVLALDDVDRIFPYSAIAGNFLAMLRAWYEKGKRSKLWKKLRLVVAHSTEVYIELNIHQSPFNVGESIELPEFNREQVQDLAQRQGLDWQDSQVDQRFSL
jgi:transcriptional regulator with XRE-family HTH domain